MTTHQFSFYDIDALLESARRANYSADYVQLQPGPLSLSYETLTLSKVSIIRKQLNRSIECWGAPRKDHCAFLLVVSGDQFRLNGFNTSSSPLYLVPPGAEIEMLCGREFTDLVSIAVPISALASHTPLDLLSNQSSTGGGVRPLTCDNTNIAALTACVGGCMMRDLDEDTRLNLEPLLIQTLAGILKRQLPEDSLDDQYGRRAKLAYITKTRSIVLDPGVFPPQISEIAQQCSTTTRSLERVFRNEVGTSPKNYIWSHRLEMARRIMSSLKGCKLSISTVATDCGFEHLSRFSQYFSSQFGILPSEYRKRTQDRLLQ